MACQSPSLILALVAIETNRSRIAFAPLDPAGADLAMGQPGSDRRGGV